MYTSFWYYIAMNMFKPVGATTVDEYIALLPEVRKDAILAIDALIQETVPGLRRHFAYNMLGYGTFPYTNYKKELIDWPIIAVASQKNYISIYVCALEDGQYIAERYKSELGKVSVGKSCIRFRKLEDVNLETLRKVLKIAATKPGIIV